MQCRRAGFDPWVRALGWKIALEREMATHPSILAWRIPWTEEPGGLHTIHRIAELDLTEQFRDYYFFSFHFFLLVGG